MRLCRYFGIAERYALLFNRKLLLTTLTLLNAIAAPAIIGSSKNPFIG